MKKSTLTTAMVLTLLFALVSCGQGPDQKQTDGIEPLTGAEREKYLSSGKEIAQSTFVALSGRLASAMQEGGVENALNYCSLAAFPLVDSLSRVHQADIRRTSLKIRNPKDAPAEAERKVLELYESSEKKGEELSPQVLLVNGQKVAFYAPIRIQPLCLQCHGKVGQDIQQENYALIQRLYPGDQATGYSLNELRGMWSITFDREEPVIK